MLVPHANNPLNRMIESRISLTKSIPFINKLETLQHCFWPLRTTKTHTTVSGGSFELDFYCQGVPTNSKMTMIDQMPRARRVHSISDISTFFNQKLPPLSTGIKVCIIIAGAGVEKGPNRHIFLPYRKCLVICQVEKSPDLSDDQQTVYYY